MKLLHPQEAEKLHNLQEVEVATRIQSLSKYSTEVEKTFLTFKEKLDENAKALEADFSSFAAETSAKRNVLLKEIEDLESKRKSLAEIDWERRHTATEAREMFQLEKGKELQAVKNKLGELEMNLIERETNCAHRENTLANAEKSHSERVSRAMENELRLDEDRKAYGVQVTVREQGLEAERVRVAQMFKDLAFQQDIYQRDMDQLRMEKIKLTDEKKHIESQQHDLRAAYLLAKDKGIIT